MTKKDGMLQKQISDVRRSKANENRSQTDKTGGLWSLTPFEPNAEFISLYLWLVHGDPLLFLLPPLISCPLTALALFSVQCTGLLSPCSLSLKCSFISDPHPMPKQISRQHHHSKRQPLSNLFSQTSLPIIPFLVMCQQRSQNQLCLD